MSGWAGGIANREWKRDRRGPDSGRLNACADVARILAAWREQHGWQPGSAWDPHAGMYVVPSWLAVSGGAAPAADGTTTTREGR